MVIVIAGPPCSGKSTIASEFARRFRIPHLSMDRTRQRILPGAAHTRSDRQAAYRAMTMTAEIVQGLGADILLDAPYGHGEDRTELEPLNPLWIECRVAPEEAVRRLRERGYDPERPDLNEAIVYRSAADYHYSAPLVLDTEVLSLHDCIERIAERYRPGNMRSA